jgi:hypothetical protein
VGRYMRRRVYLKISTFVLFLFSAFKVLACGCSSPLNIHEDQSDVIFKVQLLSIVEKRLSDVSITDIKIQIPYSIMKFKVLETVKGDELKEVYFKFRDKGVTSCDLSDVPKHINSVFLLSSFQNRDENGTLSKPFTNNFCNLRIRI